MAYLPHNSLGELGLVIGPSLWFPQLCNGDKLTFLKSPSNLKMLESENAGILSPNLQGPTLVVAVFVRPMDQVPDSSWQPTVLLLC